MSFLSQFLRKPKKQAEENYAKKEVPLIVEPGRVSVPDDNNQGSTLLALFNGTKKLITPSFRTEVIPLLRNLYKVNPDVGIALQDMFKLANCGHTIKFPNNTDAQEQKMIDHLRTVSDTWSRYTAGIDGLVNKFITQCLVTGAISVEAVPNKELNGLATILFLKPETILFERESNGVYRPYQKNPLQSINNKPSWIPLNPQTYFYIGMFNDLDEPYGIPPFMAALDSIKGQHDMKENFKNIMEIMGMLGFLQVSLKKPNKKASESESAYESRLVRLLRQTKQRIKGGMRDGIVAGYEEDHEFDFKATSASLANVNEIWGLNQQSVANGLGVNGNIIGVSEASTEGGAGVLLSKLISQLRNIQMLVGYTLKQIYSLELRLAGMDNKGMEIIFNTTTIADEVKVQQGMEYKVRNLISLYNQGILSQEDLARELGYRKADRKKPRIQMQVTGSNLSPANTGSKGDKATQQRKAREKKTGKTKRRDQSTKK
jgi:hypothetical protein